MDNEQREFANVIDRSKDALADMVDTIADWIRQGITQEAIYAQLAIMFGEDRDRAATCATVAIVELAKAKVAEWNAPDQAPRSCDRHACYRCEMEDL